MTPSEQPFVVRFDRADGIGVARFANVGHVNEPVRERNWLPLGSLHRLIAAGTYQYWNLCFFRSEHCPVPQRHNSDGEMCLFGGRWHLSTGPSGYRAEPSEGANNAATSEVVVMAECRKAWDALQG